MHEQEILVHYLKGCVKMWVDGRAIHIELRSNPRLNVSLKENQFYLATKEASLKLDLGWDSLSSSASFGSRMVKAVFPVRTPRHQKLRFTYQENW